MAKIIKLTENQFGEMMAYHGSGADFDKFNHKKYLNTGAGSQCFGWGTYVTNDMAVANGYVVNASLDKSENYDLEDAVYKGLIKNGMPEEDAVYEYNSVYQELRYCLSRCSLDKTIEYLQEVIKNPQLYNVKDSTSVKAMLYALENKPKADAYLYEVDIPDDNGFNYLSWYDDLTNEQLNSIHSRMDEFSKTHNKVDFYNFTEHSQRFARPNGVNAAYDSLKYAFYIAGVDKEKCAKAASLFLVQCGFDGIKYPAGTRWQKPDGASEDAYNYVIFDANKVKIVNKTRM